MSTWLIAIVTGLYVCTAVSASLTRQWGLSIMFVGYALANLGVIWIARGGR